MNTAEMNKYYDLSEKKRLAFFIGISEKTITLLKKEHSVKLAEHAAECCWEWLINNKYDGEFFNELLDNEENGIAIIDEKTDDIVESAVWNCLIDAVAYTSRLAYDKENAKYYPEPIALVDDDLVEHLLECYHTCFPDGEYVDKLLDSLLSADPDNYLECYK